MKEERKQKRHKDRPLYVPPIFRRGVTEDRLPVEEENRDNQKHAIGLSRQVELIGKFGRIGDYEFEYTRREDAEHAASLLQIPGRYEEWGLVEHVESLDSKDLSNDEEKNFSRTLRSDSSSVNKNKSKYNRLIDNVDFIIPENQNWSYNPGSAAVKKKNTSVNKNNESNHDVSSESVEGKKLRIPRTVNNKETKTSKLNKSFTSFIKPTENDFSVYTFEHEIFHRFPDSICRRLINALWIRLFYSRIKECQSNESALESLPEIINISLKYFNELAKTIQQHFSVLTKYPESLHCLCCVYIILGDITRYRDMYELHSIKQKLNRQLCSEEEAVELKSRLFLETKRFYKRAQRFYPQEGHIYSQFGYVSAYTEEVLERIMFTLRSCISTFSYRNQDTLTMLLATGFKSPEAKGNQSNLHNFFRIFLSLIQSLYSKIRLEHFDNDLELLNNALECVLKSPLTSFVVNQFIIVVCITMLIMVETSNLWELNQFHIGQEITQKLNQVRLSTRPASHEGAKYEVFEIDDSNYFDTRSEIQNLYKQICTDFSSVFECLDINSFTDLNSKNERFRLSCTLFCSIGIKLLLNAKSPVSALWEVLTLVLFWMYHLNLFCVDSGALAPHIFKLRTLFLDRLSEFQEDFDSRRIPLATLGYILPEDNWFSGFIKIPLRFRGHENLSFETKSVVYVTRKPEMMNKSSSETEGDDIIRRSKSFDFKYTKNKSINLVEENLDKTIKVEKEKIKIVKNEIKRSRSADAFVVTKDKIIEANLPVVSQETPCSLIRLARFFALSWTMYPNHKKDQFIKKLNVEEITTSNSIIKQKKGLIQLQEPIKHTLKKKKSHSKHRNKRNRDKRILRSSSLFRLSANKHEENSTETNDDAISLSVSNRPVENQHIVIDGKSVGSWHQRSKDIHAAKQKKTQYCSIEGIDVAVEYYLKNKCQVLVFLPDYVVERELQKEKTSETTLSGKITSIITKFENQQILAAVPSQDPDWSYIVETAYRLNSCVVSNRSLQEMYEELQGEQRDIMRWLKVRIISFTFVDNEFLPNPDFIFPI